jgi:ribonuclease R
MDGERDAGPEVPQALDWLRSVSRSLRSARAERGSIDFDLPESRVVLNAAGEPTDIERVLRLEAHRLIEDFMILANETVAELALREEVPLLFRVHESPDEEKMNRLRELASTFGFHLPARPVEPRDLARLVDAMEGTPQEQLISTATLRSMKQARYAPENLGHFGLASRAYAHFTSPIRRYPDLIVHRQLGRWLQDPASARKLELDRLSEIARHCSERERRAVEAERDSVDLKKIEFMERHLGGEFEGTISGVTAFGLFVLLDEFHVDGLVHVSTLEDDYYVYVEEQHALLGQRRRRRFQLGDRVRVQVARVDREARHIDFELLGTEG